VKHIQTIWHENLHWQETGFRNNPANGAEKIMLDPTKRLQKVIGFGGAFTEASAYNLNRIGKSVREKAIEAYFDPVSGLGYSLGRVSIHGCDFSLGSYLYIDDYDDTLASFDISRDKEIIKLILDSEKVAEKPIGIVASPWTPPFWMKTNNSPIRGGHLKPEYYQTWADYFVKFIKSYREFGVDVQYITVQNEPAAIQRWDSCIFEPEEEREFVKVLGKTLADNKLSSIKILVWDHNRDLMLDRAKVIYNDLEAAKYVWGTAFHWYGEEKFANVETHHRLYPEKHLMFTEGCQEQGPHIGDAEVGIRYARNIINDFRGGTEGFIDWNLYLDETGGPNHVNNLCSAPIIIRIFQEELILMPAYYAIGHLSRYVKPGAIQIGSSGTDKLQYVAFQNPGFDKVLVILNENVDKVSVEIDVDGESIHTEVDGKSISTILL